MVTKIILLLCFTNIYRPAFLTPNLKRHTLYKPSTFIGKYSFFKKFTYTFQHISPDQGRKHSMHLLRIFFKNSSSPTN